MKVAKINKEDGRVLEVREERDDAELGEDEIEVHGDDAGDDAEPGIHRWDGEKFVELSFKAMRLDAAGILLAVEELPSSDYLTPQHVDLRPYGGHCDNEPGKYRWDAENRRLVPLKRHEQLSAPAGVSLEAAVAQLLELNPSLKQGDKTMVWLAGYRASVDGKGGKK